jgi:hypothetical protein
VASQDLVANPVVLSLDLVAVLEAVDFNYEPSGETGEVEVVAAERVLAMDHIALRAQASESGPEDDLRLAHVAA